MTQWFTLRRVPLLAVASSAVSLLCWLAGHLEVSFVSMTGEAGVLAPLRLFLPLLVVVCLGHCLDGAVDAERLSARPVRLLDLALLLVPIIVLSGLEPLGVEAGGILRNSLGLIGAMLAASMFVPMQFAALLPVAWVMVAALAGRSGEGFHSWAWPVLTDDPHGGVWAGVLLALGGVAYVIPAFHETAFRLRRA